MNISHQVLIAVAACRYPAGYRDALQAIEQTTRGKPLDRLDAWPSQARLARMAGLCVRHVRRILKRLAADGLITNVGQVASRRGRGVTIWRLSLAAIRQHASITGLQSPNEPKTNIKQTSTRRSLRSPGIHEAPKSPDGTTQRGWDRAVNRVGDWSALMDLGNDALKLARRLS